MCDARWWAQVGMLKMIRNLAFAHRSQHVQQGRFNTEDEVRAPEAAPGTRVRTARARHELWTRFLCAGYRLRARTIPLAAHDGLRSRGSVQSM